MNEKFRTIGLDTEDKITEFIDYIDDLGQCFCIYQKTV